jgi:hypothetical protein
LPRPAFNQQTEFRLASAECAPADRDAFDGRLTTLDISNRRKNARARVVEYQYVLIKITDTTDSDFFRRHKKRQRECRKPRLADYTPERR